MAQLPPKPDSETVGLHSSDVLTAAGEPAVGGSHEPDRDLLMQKELTENLKEVIQARDLEIKYLQNTIEVQERLLQNYPSDRVFGAIYDLYLRFNELFPSGTRRRRLMGRLVDLLARR
jgi:hypothetical protein